MSNKLGSVSLNDGRLTVVGSNLIDNTAVNGGAVYNRGHITISHTTVYANKYEYYWISSTAIANDATAAIYNSTISGNISTGIDNYADLRIVHSTITDNSDVGIFNYATLTLENTLVSGNQSYGVFNDAPDAFITVDAFNLFGHTDDSGMYGFTPGPTDILPWEELTDIIDPALLDNGGPTQTHALTA